MTFCSVDPVELMRFPVDARKFRSGLLDGILKRLGQEARIGAVGIVHELALAADDDGATFLFELLFAEFDGLGRSEAAVEPSEFDGRHGTARCEFIEDDAGGRIRSTVERTGDSLDRGGVAEIETGHSNVEEMSAHVANGTDAPIDPAAPIEGMVDGVIGDARANAEEEVPRKSLRDRIIPCHSSGETSVNTSGIPFESVK